jgi:hypothetical protein
MYNTACVETPVVILHLGIGLGEECCQSAKVGHFGTEHFGLIRRGEEAL